MCRSYLASTYSATVQYCPETATTLTKVGLCKDNCVTKKKREKPGEVLPRGLSLHLDLAQTTVSVTDFQHTWESRRIVLLKICEGEETRPKIGLK